MHREVRPSGGIADAMPCGMPMFNDSPAESARSVSVSSDCTFQAVPTSRAGSPEPRGSGEKTPQSITNMRPIGTRARARSHLEDHLVDPADEVRARSFPAAAATSAMRCGSMSASTVSTVNFSESFDHSRQDHLDAGGRLEQQRAGNTRRGCLPRGRLGEVERRGRGSRRRCRRRTSRAPGSLQARGRTFSAIGSIENRASRVRSIAEVVLPGEAPDEPDHRERQQRRRGRR